MHLCYIETSASLNERTQLSMTDPSDMAESSQSGQRSSEALYCPNCAREVTDPLICGDCSAVICRVCGTPLESSADLGIG